jgi:hypothetical protein
MIMDNGYAMGLLESSNNNNIISNTITGSKLNQEGIHMDSSSRLNCADNNTIGNIFDIDQSISIIEK